MSTSFQMPGQKGNVSKEGIVTWTVPYFVEDLADVFTVGRTPPASGLAEVARSWTDIEGAGLQVDVEYEGLNGSSDGSEFEPTYDYDSSFKDETLLAHPEWKRIKEEHKGTYDKEEKRIEFPEFLAGVKAGLGGGGPTQRKNPMFGLETFLSLSSVFRRTYVRTSVPDSIFTEIGTIREALPNGFPTPPGRNWLIMPPKITQRGSAFQITEELMLSQPGGWPENVYKLIQV